MRFRRALKVLSKRIPFLFEFFGQQLARVCGNERFGRNVVSSCLRKASCAALLPAKACMPAIQSLAAL
jgi:hypothetical protein